MKFIFSNVKDFVKNINWPSFLILVLGYVFLSSLFVFFQTNSVLEFSFLFLTSVLVGAFFFSLYAAVVYVTASLAGYKNKGFKQVMLSFFTIIILYYYLLLLNEFILYLANFSEEYVLFSSLAILIIGTIHALYVGVKAFKLVYKTSFFKSLLFVISPLLFFFFSRDFAP